MWQEWMENVPVIGDINIDDIKENQIREIIRDEMSRSKNNV